MVFTFDDATHQGMYGDTPVPSVTQLISEFKLVDYSMVPHDRLEYKRVLGTAVDVACDYWEKDCLDIKTLHKDVLPYFNAYRKFREIEDFEIDLDKSLSRYYSKTWRYSGQPDLVGVYQGKNVIIDRKCTWVLYESGHVQTAAYQFLIEENIKKFKIKERYLLKLNPNGNYDLVKAKSYTEELQDFFACVRLHWRKREIYKTTKGVEHEQSNNPTSKK